MTHILQYLLHLLFFVEINYKLHDILPEIAGYKLQKKKKKIFILSHNTITTTKILTLIHQYQHI